MNLAAGLLPEMLDLAYRLAAVSADERDAAIGRLPAQQQRNIAEAILSVPVIGARIGATCALTPRQVEAEYLLNSASTHCMLFGGSRSGKTFLICREIARRALAAPGSRHAILRFRFSHLA